MNPLNNRPGPAAVQLRCRECNGIATQIILRASYISRQIASQKNISAKPTVVSLMRGKSPGSPEIQ